MVDPARTACEYGPTAAGASVVEMIFFMEAILAVKEARTNRTGCHPERCRRTPRLYLKAFATGFLPAFAQGFGAADDFARNDSSWGLKMTNGGISWILTTQWLVGFERKYWGRKTS